MITWYCDICGQAVKRSKMTEIILNSVNEKFESKHKKRDAIGCCHGVLCFDCASKIKEQITSNDYIYCLSRVNKENN